MTTAHSAPAFSYPTPEKKTIWSSLGWALGIELSAVVLIALYLVFRQVAPSFSTLPIEIEDIPKTEPVKQEIKKPEPIKPKVEPKPIKAVQPPPVPVAQTPQVQPTPVAETPNAFTAPAPVPPPPPVAARAVGPSDEYKAKVQAAVQAAFYYPMAAQEMGLTGRTRVGFVLTNTTASDAKIVTSSTIGIIDRAALQAVLKAVFPSPPAELRDKAIAYEIWIEFKPKAN
jgi:TonB family protein